MNKYMNAVGIDLGTTNCVVCKIDDNDNVVTVTDSDGNDIFPTFIKFDESNGKVSYKAGRKAKEESKEEPDKVVSSFKTYMGKRDTNGNQIVIKEINGKKLSPEMCSAFMLKYLKSLASKNIGTDVTQAVITVPAYFKEAQKSATELSARKAGLEILKIINEPTAAVYAYGKELKEDEDEKVVLAYDLGGGTFDLSLISLEKDEEGLTSSNVIETSGDTNLGGDNVDRAIASSFLKGEMLNPNNSEHSKIIRLSELAKIELTNEYHKGNLNYVFKQDGYELSMSQFLNLLEPYIVSTIQLTKELIENNDVKDDIDEIILVGGSTRLPLIREKLSEYFGGKFTVEYFKDYIMSPDYAVGLGAGAVMKTIVDKDRVNIHDVMPIPIKIKTIEGYKTLIPKGYPIPSTRKELFYNESDNQELVEIKIFEGLEDNESSLSELGVLPIPIQPAPAGTVPILVKLCITENSTICVEVKIGKTTKLMEIKRHFETNETLTSIIEGMEKSKDYSHVSLDFLK